MTRHRCETLCTYATFVIVSFLFPLFTQSPSSLLRHSKKKMHVDHVSTIHPSIAKHKYLNLKDVFFLLLPCFMSEERWSCSCFGVFHCSQHDEHQLRGMNKWETTTKTKKENERENSELARNLCWEHIFSIYAATFRAEHNILFHVKKKIFFHFTSWRFSRRCENDVKIRHTNFQFLPPPDGKMMISRVAHNST